MLTKSKRILSAVLAVFMLVTVFLPTVLDYMRYAVRYLISTQQYFEWAV